MPSSDPHQTPSGLWEAPVQPAQDGTGESIFGGSTPTSSLEHGRRRIVPPPSRRAVDRRLGRLTPRRAWSAGVSLFFTAAMLAAVVVMDRGDHDGLQASGASDRARSSDGAPSEVPRSTRTPSRSRRSPKPGPDVSRQRPQRRAPSSAVRPVVPRAPVVTPPVVPIAPPFRTNPIVAPEFL